MTSERLALSVIVCTHNRVSSLLRCLRSLALQATPKAPPIEVLVVANDCSDGTLEEASSLIHDYPFPLSVHCEPRRGLSIARNQGAKLARSPVLVYVDDDVTFRPGWLLGWCAAFADPLLDAAGGPIDPVFESNVDERLRDALLAIKCPTTGWYEHGPDRKPFVPQGPIGHPRGGNMGIRASAMQRVGGFREDLGFGTKLIPGEETELFHHLVAAGGHVFYVPEPRVLHHLEANKVNWSYHRALHIGKGRASVLIHPPISRIRGALQAVEQAWVFFFHSLAWLFAPHRPNLRSFRKRWSAIGKLQELTRLRATRLIPSQSMHIGNEDSRDPT